MTGMMKRMRQLVVIAIALFICGIIAFLVIGCAHNKNDNDKNDGNTEKELSITAEDISYFYDGQEHGIDIKGLRDGDKVEYSLDGVNFTSEQIKYSEVGKYEIHYKVERNGETIKTDKVVMYISKKILQGITSENKEIEYDGLDHSIELSGIQVGDKISYSLDGNNYETEEIKLKEVGIYTVYYIVERGFEEYRNSCLLTIKEKTITLKIDNEDIEIKCREKKEIEDIYVTVEYDGLEHYISPETNGTLCVKKNGEYTTIIPKYTEVGRYEYEFLVVENGYLPTEVKGVLEITASNNSEIQDGIYYRANGVITISGNIAERNGIQINKSEITKVDGGVVYLDEEYIEIGDKKILEIRIDGASYVDAIEPGSDYYIKKIGNEIVIEDDEEEIYFSTAIDGNISKAVFCGKDLMLMPPLDPNDEPFYVIADNLIEDEDIHYFVLAIELV